MQSNSQRFSSQLLAFEQSLLRQWNLDSPATPKALHHYEGRWRDFFKQPHLGATEQEMMREIAHSACVIVSDFHPLKRSRQDFSNLVAKMAQRQSTIVVLELLDAEIEIQIGDYVADEICLNNSQTLVASYPLLFDEHRRSKYQINGAWIEGTPSQRDLSTAEKIKSIRSKQRESKVAIHFGDWHLAPQHLPQQLSRLGMDATCVHLSPRPLWDLQRRRIFDDVVKLENQHWAWMRTPPLANTSAFMLEYSAANADEYCEESACLVETAANQLAKFLNVPTPYSAFEIYLDHDWDSFQNLLSNEGSQVMSTKPNIPVCHPTLGLMWTPQDVDAHHIVQGAAHLVYCENFQTGDAFTDLFRSYVFRFLCTLSVNPFFKLATCGDDNEHQWVMRGAFRVAKELNQDNNASVGKLLSSFKHVELWDYELQALRDTIKVA